MSGERTNVPDDRRVMFDEDDDGLDLRLAAAAVRNRETAACNGRSDCTSKVHLPICEARRD